MEETLNEIQKYIEVTYPDEWYLPNKLEILKLKFLAELKQQKIDQLKKEILELKN